MIEQVNNERKNAKKKKITTIEEKYYIWGLNVDIERFGKIIKVIGQYKIKTLAVRLYF